MIYFIFVLAIRHFWSVCLDHADVKKDVLIGKRCMLQKLHIELDKMFGYLGQKKANDCSGELSIEIGMVKL